MAIQTRGQITLLSKPDVTISMTPELITIPVNSNGELIDSLSFTETIAIQAKDSKGKTLYFESINIDETGKSKDWLSQEDLVKEGLLEIIQEIPGDETSPIIGYRYFFKRTKEQVKEELNPTGFINFGFVMENKFDIADDDFSDYRTISYIKAKSGQDGTPAYSVDIAGEQQVFVRTINPDGTYSYEPETITLTAIPINFEGSSFEPYYKWFKYGTEENYLQQGQGEGANKLEIFPDRNDYGVGVYVCEIYRSISGKIEDSPVARDYASIGMATNGIDNYTVSLTNDNAVVTVDNLQHALEDGTVSTGIIVYKGANKINPNDYFIEIENEKDGEVKFSAILNTEDPDNSFWEVQASYKKGEYVGAIGEFIIKVGGIDFKKRFQVSPSLMGGTSRLIKISGQQYFRINQDGSSYTPNDITLTAHLSNVEFLRWEYQNPENKEEWPTITNASLSLDVNFDGVYWQEDNLAKFRAVATAENIEYYDEYTVYKFKEGQNSINVIASNESINIITDVFGKIDPSIDNTIETIYFTVFNGADASTDIKIPEDKIEITPDVSSMISVSSQSNALKIGITRDNNKVFTPATIKVELSNGATKTISLKPLQQGLSARTLTIYGNQVFKYSNSTTGEIKYNPSQITIHTQYQNIESYSWYYRIGDGPNQDLTVTGDSYSFTPSNFSEWLADQILTIGVKEKNPPAGSTAITDEITIHQVYDGSNGKDSSLVFLNNPSITITEDSEGKLVGETFECEVLGITGNENVTPTGISWDNKPNWMSITLNETKLQLEVSDDVPTSNIQDRQGFITVYTTSPINVSMQLHWTIVKNGKDGQNGIDYALTPSQAVLRKDANSGISPSELTFSATIKEGSGLAKPLIGYIECYSSTDGENFNSNPIKTNTNSSLTITADAGWAAIKGKLYEDSSKKVLLDEQTVIVIESSSASFVASLDNEYIPVVCDAYGNVLDNDGNLGTCKITAYLNGIEITDYSTNLSISVAEGSGYISYTSSISNGSITINSLRTDKAKIKFTITQAINNTLTKIDKYLKIEKIKQGKDGQDGQPGPQGPTGPTGPQGPQGPQGNPGQDAKEIDRIIKYYVKHNNSDSAPPANGASYSNNSWFVYGYANGEYTYWQTTIPTLDTTNKYIWSLDLITYKNNTNDYLITNIKRDYGAEGLLIAQDFDVSGLENYFTRTDGLIQFAQGSDGISLTGNNSIFKVTSNAMGFFEGTGSNATPLCYYENGNMVLRGTVYANEGVIGGVGENLTNAWRIKGYSKTENIETPAAIYSGVKSSLNSTSPGIYIGTDGISMGGSTLGGDNIFSLGEIEEDGVKSYRLSLKDVDITFPDNFILPAENGGTGQKDSLNAGIAVGLYRENSIEKRENLKNITTLKNGDLCLVYSESGTEVTVNASSDINNTSGNYDDFGSYSNSPGRTRFGFSSRYWNIRNYSGETVSAPYCRVGSGTGPLYDNSSNLYVPIVVKTNGGSIKSVTLSFRAATKPSGANRDITSCTKPISVSLHSSFNNATAIATATSKMPNSGASSSVQNCTVTLNSDVAITSGIYYVVFSTTTTNSLRWIDRSSLSIGGTTGSNTILSAYSQGDWVDLVSVDSIISGSYSLSLGTWTYSNGLPIILSGSPSSTVYIPTASSSKAGLVKTGGTLANTSGYSPCMIGTDGVIYASSSGVNVGSGLTTLNGALTLNSTKVTHMGTSNSTYYSNIYIKQSSTPPTGTNGDICFVY